MAAFIEDLNSITNVMALVRWYLQIVDSIKGNSIKIKCKVKVNFTTINMILLIKVLLSNIQVNFFIIVSMVMEFFIITIHKNYKEDLTSPTWEIFVIIGSNMMDSLKRIKNQVNAIFTLLMENNFKVFVKTILLMEMESLKPFKGMKLRVFGEIMFLSK